MPKIYFDYNSTTPVHKEVLDRMISVLDIPLNASSLHHHGRVARKILEDSKNIIKKILHIKESHDLIFTSSCTEANNTVLHSFADYEKICSVIEHPSIMNKIDNSVLKIDQNGIIDLEYLKWFLEKYNDRKFLISSVYASNEIGVIQPISEIHKIAKKYGHLMHSDITQAIGKIDIDISELDLITFGAHKFGGPIGVGVILYKKGLQLTPLLLGGGQEYRLRSGTQNIPAIYGLSKAFEIIEDIKSQYIKIEKLRNTLEHEITKECSEAIIFGAGAKRLPNTSCISMPNVTSETQLIFFDMNGISVSAGSACSSGKVELPKTQLSMGFSEKIAKSSIRISLGPQNTSEEVTQFIELWKNLYNKQNK
jgi:cysteine desulfurase